MTNPFNLANGEAQLAPFFSDIEKLRYPDSLVITAARPLADYILSSASIPRAGSPKEGAAALQTFIARKIEREGAIRVQKDTGMFVAQRRRAA